MAFEKEYPNRKDWRKPYLNVRKIDRSCRSHGNCPWCSSGRKYKWKKRLPIIFTEDIEDR